MAVPPITPTTQDYCAAFGDQIPLANLFTASDTVNGEVISLTKSPWSECSYPNLTLTDAATACGTITARHRRFA